MKSIGSPTRARCANCSTAAANSWSLSPLICTLALSWDRQAAASWWSPNRSRSAPTMFSYDASAGTLQCQQLGPAGRCAHARPSRKMSNHCDRPPIQIDSGITPETFNHRLSAVSTYPHCSLRSLRLCASFRLPALPAEHRCPAVWHQVIYWTPRGGSGHDAGQLLFQPLCALITVLMLLSIFSWPALSFSGSIINCSVDSIFYSTYDTKLDE
jgi:hypothetical protein